MGRMVNNKASLLIRRSNSRDFNRILTFPLCVFFGILIRNIRSESVLGIELIKHLILLFVIEYILSIIFLNYYKFYEEYLEIYYPTRIGKWRLRQINYSDIKLVRYYGDYLYDPIIRIYTSDKKKGLHLPSNSVISYSLKKTKKTLQFIQSKDIPIEIISEDEKKKRILDCKSRRKTKKTGFNE